MPDPFNDFDFAADFEAFAVGQQPVTVQSTDALSGTVLTSVEVPAVKSVRKGSTRPARGGSVPNTEQEWWLRVDRLGFVLKTQDRIVEESGTTWLVAEVNEVAGALARCPVIKMR